MQIKRQDFLNEIKQEMELRETIRQAIRFTESKRLKEENTLRQVVRKLISEAKTSKIKVTGTIKRHGRYKKIRVVKFKRRKHYMRSHGHKQGFTEVKIESIK